VSDRHKQLRWRSKYTETRNMECTFIAQGWYKYTPIIHWFPSCRWLCQKLHKSVVSRAGKPKCHIGTNRAARLRQLRPESGCSTSEHRTHNT
jgi:hypothetical protein